MNIMIELSNSPNIGDSFYQNVIIEIFKKLYPDSNIIPISSPIEKEHKIKKESFFYRNCFDGRGFLKGDLWIFSGPILGERFLWQYAPLIKEIKNKGGNYLLLSVTGPHECTHKGEIGNFLSQYPPLFFSSRASSAFNTYKQHFQNIYNGVCTAFFSSIFFKRPKAVDKIITVSMYSQPEPFFDFQVNEEGIDLTSINISNSTKSNWNLYRHLNWLKNYPAELKGYKILRPVHDTSLKFNYLKFSQPNSVLSFSADDYYSIYSNTEFTLSDRIHACVLSLSYGNSSLLVGEWDRADLFERLKINSIGKVMLPPEEDAINKELVKLEEQIIYNLNCIND